MQAFWMLSLVWSWTVFGAAQVAWKAPLADCLPVDLAVSPAGPSYVTCQKSYGAALLVNGYESNGRLAQSRTLTAPEGESWLPRDLLWHEGVLYLSFTARTSVGTDAQLLALDPTSLDVLWQQEERGFTGNNLVPLASAGIWWLGMNDARDADILAFRYTADGMRQASFRYDSGEHDSLGFDRRSGAAAPEQGLYVGGFSEVIRVAGDGKLLWKNNFPTAAISSRSDGKLIATHMRAPEGSTAQFAADGRRLWEIDQGGSSLAQAADESIWLAGTRVTNQTANWDLRVLHLTSKGQVETLDVYAGAWQDRAVDISTDAAGHAYVLASSHVKSGLQGPTDRSLILKYDAKGRRLWSHLYGVMGLPEALHVTSGGDVYALGRDGTIFVRNEMISAAAASDNEKEKRQGIH